MSEIKKIAETPRGELEWVMIRGDGKEQLNGPNKYQAQLVLDPDQVDEKTTEDQAAAAKLFQQDVEDFWADNKPKHIKTAKSMGFYPHTVLAAELDEDGEKVYEPTGKVAFLFKTGTEYKDGKNKVIKVFNKKNNVVDIGDLLIGNGSIGRLAGAMATYEVKPPKGNKALEAGVTFYLDAVKLLKLEEYVGGTQFGTEDDDMDGAWGDDDETWTGEEEATSDSKAKPRL